MVGEEASCYLCGAFPRACVRLPCCSRPHCRACAVRAALRRRRQQGGGAGGGCWVQGCTWKAALIDQLVPDTEAREQEALRPAERPPTSMVTSLEAAAHSRLSADPPSKRLSDKEDVCDSLEGNEPPNKVARMMERQANCNRDGLMGSYKALFLIAALERGGPRIFDASLMQVSAGGSLVSTYTFPACLDGSFLSVDEVFQILQSMIVLNLSGDETSFLYCSSLAVLRVVLGRLDTVLRGVVDGFGCFESFYEVYRQSGHEKELARHTGSLQTIDQFKRFLACEAGGGGGGGLVLLPLKAKQQMFRSMEEVLCLPKLELSLLTEQQESSELNVDEDIAEIVVVRPKTPELVVLDEEVGGGGSNDDDEPVCLDIFTAVSCENVLVNPGEHVTFLARIITPDTSMLGEKALSAKVLGNYDKTKASSAGLKVVPSVQSLVQGYLHLTVKNEAATLLSVARDVQMAYVEVLQSETVEIPFNNYGDIKPADDVNIQQFETVRVRCRQPNNSVAFMLMNVQLEKLSCVKLVELQATRVTIQSDGSFFITLISSNPFNKIILKNTRIGSVHSCLLRDEVRKMPQQVFHVTQQQQKSQDSRTSFAVQAIGKPLDQVNQVATELNTRSVVISGISSSIMNCHKVFNICCLYGNVVKIKFLANQPDTVFVLMNSYASAHCLVKSLHGRKLSNKTLLVKQERENAELAAMSVLPDRTQGEVSFKGSVYNRIGKSNVYGSQRSKPPSAKAKCYGYPLVTPKEEVEKMLRSMFQAGGLACPKLTHQGQKTKMNFISAAAALEAVAVCGHVSYTSPDKFSWTLKMLFED